jgi:hypothetical protein
MTTIGMAAVACALSGCPHPNAKPLALVVSGDTAGWIVPCGCTSNQSGGLLRRGTYVADLRKTHEVLLVDAGGAAGGVSDYDRAKFAAILAGEREMSVVAHNLGAAEVQFGTEYIRKAIGQGVPLVSCNVRDSQGELLAPAHRIQTLGGQRIAILGVLSPQSPKLDKSKVKAEAPREAILASLRQLKGKYDRLVILAYLAEDELLELASNLPEADAVIGGPTGQSITPRMVGPTLVAAATNKGKFLAQITVPALGSPQAWQGEIIELNERFANQPEQEANLQKFYVALEQADFTPEQTSFTPDLPADPPADFRVAGSAACRECHAAEHAAWEKSTHSHAWKSLTTTRAHVDADCQRCHTTSYGYPGGFVSAGRSLALVGVGCESCHGPSAAHARSAEVHTHFYRQADQKCTQCHDRENSPQFVYDDYWSRIAHGTKAPQGSQP